MGAWVLKAGVRSEAEPKASPTETSQHTCKSAGELKGLVGMVGYGVGT